MSRDGEHKDCPIIPNQMVRIPYGEDDEEALLVAPSHDSVQIFPDSRYNHLRYFNHEEGALQAIFLPAEILAQLVEVHGIPMSKRESITEGEVECYEYWLGKIASLGYSLLEETNTVEPSEDFIEAEVQRAHEHIDAELDFYIREWE